MKNTMTYKDYIGSVEFSEADGVFFGKVLGVRALISYEGDSAQSLVQDFHAAVDDYLALCTSNGQMPEKAYKGSFNVRLSPQLHREAAVYATEHEMTLNALVEKAVSAYVSPV